MNLQESIERWENTGLSLGEGENFISLAIAEIRRLEKLVARYEAEQCGCCDYLVYDFQKTKD
jgi:hypothetical protein